jgi:hypothetical protein
MGFLPTPNTAALQAEIDAITNTLNTIDIPNIVSGIGGGPEGYSNVGNKTGAATFDLKNGNYQLCTLTGNVTSITLSNTQFTMTAGKVYVFRLSTLQDATGGRTISWTGSTFVFLVGDNTPNPNPSTKTDWIIYSYDAGVTWYVQKVNLKTIPYFDQIVSPTGDRGLFFNNSGGTFGANSALYMRCPVRAAGRLKTLSIGPQTLSGNYDVGILRQRVDGTALADVLYTKGSTAMSGLTASQWNSVIEDTGVDTFYGDDIWLSIACDNATATWWRKTLGSAAGSTLPANFAQNDIAIFCGSKTASFPIPTVGNTVDMSTLASAQPFAICCRTA